MSCTRTRDRGVERQEEIQNVSRCFDGGQKSVRRTLKDNPHVFSLTGWKMIPKQNFQANVVIS